jgi:hypothetical protein
MGVRERIAALVEPLKEEEQLLIEQRDAKQAELGEILNELREVQKLLKVADPEAYQTNGPKPKTKSGKSTSEESINRIFRAMWAEPAETWTLQKLADKTGLHISTVNPSIQILRARGDVRSIGRLAKTKDRKGPPPLGFKIAETATPPEADNGS